MEKKAKIMWCVIAILAVGNIYQFFWNGTRLSAPAVPDEETAIVIAKAVLTAIYGEELISEKDYVATVGGVTKAWTVSTRSPPGLMGRTFEVIIRMRDGRIMNTRIL